MTKIKINDITIPWYAPRGETDEGFIDDLARSLKESGQWNPIMVRLNDNKEYELISGLQRLSAAKKLNWTEIDANIVDVNESKAALLAIETNLVRKELQQIEEGKAIKEMMDKLELTQQEIAERLGKSQMWVSNRLSLALDLVEPVREMIKNNYLSPTQAVFISRLPPNKQSKFGELIIKRQGTLERKLTNDELKNELKKFGNDTIYTIGYEGYNINSFIKVLQNTKIELVLDIRESAKSLQKPEFASKFLKDRLKEANINYLHRKDLGVPFDLREAYINGGLNQDCFEQWYVWNITKRGGNKIHEVSDTIKKAGKTVLICYEKDVKTCHRNILADLLLKLKIFEKRRDL